MQAKFIARSDLGKWLKELERDYAVFAPRAEGEVKPGAKASGAVVYRRIDPQEAELPLELSRKATESAKHCLFPRSEALLTWRRERERDAEGNLRGETLSLTESPAERPALVFGLLSCDARGFLVFDPVYEGDSPQAVYRDNYYVRRRREAVLIVKTCSKVLNTCFCTWVGGSPASPEGADVLATECAATGQEGYFLEPMSDKGVAVLGSPILRDASPEEADAARLSRLAAEEGIKAMSPAPYLKDAPADILKRFDDAAFWAEKSAPCLSCGACTYLCPTCYCFNITDEPGGTGGVRLRSWDTCMSGNFTLEASGHNPRKDKSARLRNRVGHKFSYYPGLHGGRIACCGCGRCIKSCPSFVDIRRIVLDARAATTTQTDGDKEAGRE